VHRRSRDGERGITAAAIIRSARLSDDARANARHPSSLVAQRQHRVEQLGVVPRHVDRVPPQPRALRIAQPLGRKLTKIRSSPASSRLRVGDAMSCIAA
jgi:hypothetical protein